MSSLLRAAASRFRPFAVAVGTAAGVVAATAVSVAADGAAKPPPPAAAAASEDDGGEFGIFFDRITQQKIRSAFPPKYPVLRMHKVPVNAATAAKLRRFAGCGVKLGIETYVDDGQRQVLQLCVKEPEPFGDGVDLTHDKVYVVLSSRAAEEDDEEPGAAGATARQAVVQALTHLGHLMGSTDKWSGTAKNLLGDEVKYNVEKVESLELLGTLCTDKSWDGEAQKCDCECSGLVEIVKPECGFCKFMKAGPCGLQFERWENCVAAAKDGGDEAMVMACADITFKLKECVDNQQEYYGFLDEIEKEQQAKEEFEAERAAAHTGKEGEEKTAKEGAKEQTKQQQQSKPQ